MTMAVTLALAMLLALQSSFSMHASASGGRQLLLSKADTVYHNAVVYTVDNKSSIADAVAIRKGRIQWVGKEDGYQQYVGPSTTVIDLGGKMMLPGFLDGHVHMFPRMPQIGADTPKATFDLMVKFFNELDAHNGTDPWYPFFGFKKDVFQTIWGRYPNAADLDAALAPTFAKFGLPIPPILVLEQYSHSCFMSSSYLAKLGIKDDTVVPGSTIERDPVTKKPTGYMTDAACTIAFGQDWFPGVSLDAYKADLTYFFKIMSKWGITTFMDAWSNIGKLTQNMYRAADELRKEAEARGEPLPVRFRGSYRANPEHQTDAEIVAAITALKKNYTSDAVQFHAIKIFGDGGVSSHTIVNSNHSTYIDVFPPLVQTTLTTSIPDVVRLVKLGNKRGWPVHIHSTGDGSTNAMLTAIEQAAASFSSPDIVYNARNTIAHNWNVLDVDFKRFKATNTIATVMPAFAFSPGTYDFNSDAIMFGETVARQGVPIKGFMDNDVLMSSHSDFPLNAAKLTYPVLGLQVAQTRKSIEVSSLPNINIANRLELSSSSDVFPPRGDNQNMTLDQAIRSYTINTAYALKLDKKVGSIEVGKRADLVVLDRNLLAMNEPIYATGVYKGMYQAPRVPYDPIVTVEYTIRDGFMVYNRSRDSADAPEHPTEGHGSLLDWLEHAAGVSYDTISAELKAILASAFY